VLFGKVTLNFHAIQGAVKHHRQEKELVVLEHPLKKEDPLKEEEI
jgi:hypothetical protein